MARKSRKKVLDSAFDNTFKRYKTAIYARLSKDRMKREVIETQIEMVKDFIKQHEEFRLVGTFADVGFSGTNFQRPDFLRLMECVKNGEIDCIIVKDLSRFGREHIEVGDYLEKIFPFLGIRFIAVNDEYDNIKLTPEDLIITNFKNFAHAYYAKETSRKVTTSIHNMQKRGVFRSSIAPYGYAKDPNDKHKLIINPETSPIVREIFEKSAKGQSYTEIARELNKQNIPTPSKYFLEKTGKKMVHFSEKWGICNIKTILHNDIYAGTLTLHKFEQSLYDNIKRQAVPKDEQLRFENAVVPLIDFNTFEKAKKRLDENKRVFSQTPRENNLFKSLLICGKCGYRLQLRERVRQPYYVCPNCEENKTRINFDVLSEIAIRAIKTQIKVAADFEKILSLCDKNPNSYQITEQKKQATILKNLKLELFEKYADGFISEEEFIAENSKHSAKIDILEKQILKFESDVKPRDEVLKSFLKHTRFRKLTSEILSAFVLKVVVSNDNELCIVFKFEDCFERIKSYIERIYLKRGK